MARFDAHTHIFAPEQAARRAELVARDATFAEMYAAPAAAMATAPDLLAALDEAGIDRAAVAGFAFAAPGDLHQQAEYILASAAEAGGRLVPLAPLNLALPGWIGDATRWLQSGARGFGELRPHNQGWDPLGPESDRLCRLAEESGAVLLWHVSEPLGHMYPGKAGGISPVELGVLATRFPRVRMVAAHLGGGLSFYLQMPELRTAIGNVYFDTAAASLLYDDDSVARLVALAGPGRVMFGSDYPLLSPRRQIRRLLGGLPGDVAEAVCGGTAEILFSDYTKHD